MRPDDLVKGDVLLFAPEDDCISGLICALTKSRVSHAAMYYGREGNTYKMVEENLAGLQLVDLPALDGGRVIYVRRYKSRPFAEEGVTKKADAYLANKERYAFGTLLLAGAALVSGRFIADEAIVKQVTKLLGIINSVLEKVLSRLNMHPMTCSQFVTQCYHEAGYRLFEGRVKAETAAGGPSTLAGLVLARLDEEKQLPALSDTAAVDALEKEFGSSSDAFTKEALKKFIEGAFNQVCCAILDRLSRREGAAPEATFVLPDDLMAQIALFAALVSRGTPDGRRPVFSLELAAKEIGGLADAFVSPGDLLNCERLGKID